MSVRFSILVVVLNPGERLQQTLKSIDSQTYRDFEVIVKDGGSTDGSLECIKDFPGLNIHLTSSKDKGIYDAMNQAVELSQGEYIYFLNCGDYFYDAEVLSKVANAIDDRKCKADDEDHEKPHILYGDIFERITQSRVGSNPNIDGFGCYRNVPCHQACFYDRRLVSEHPFDITYKVRADYEQFLWCFYKKETEFSYINEIIADYEGGGFSETKEHLKLSKYEHQKITSHYMKASDLFKYKAILFLTLAPLRTAISRNEKTAQIYNRVKRLIYKR